MNRSAFNSTILGSGSRLPLSFVAATQALYLIAVMSARVIRRGIVHQSMHLSGTPTVRVKRFFKAVEQLSLTYSAECRQWIKVYEKIVQNFALGYEATNHRFAVMKASVAVTLVPSLRASITRFIKVAQGLALTGAVKLRTAVRAGFSQAMSLFGTLTAFDVTTTPANAERTVVVESANRVVVVPGESYDAGV